MNPPRWEIDILVSEDNDIAPAVAKTCIVGFTCARKASFQDYIERL